MKLTEAERLEKVKSMTNYTSEYHNEFLSGWIEEAAEMLRNSGVNDETIEDSRSVGVIAQIVSDIVDNGGVSDGTKYRITQLAMTYPRR